MPEGGRDGELLPGLDSVPGLARVAAGAWYRTALWSVGAGISAAERVGSVAMAGLGIADDARTEAEAAATDAIRQRRESKAEEQPADRFQTLRERGADLLDRASDVEEDRNVIHPGFARIIDQLAPDEARILKLLINEGAQGIVYVNKAAPFGFGAREIARRLSMIGHEAGCLHIELVAAYLDNLVSHGLVAIRRDALDDEVPYQVIEAQPEVVAALREAGGPIFRGQITRRSVHLTDFGQTFCQVCFPPEHLPAGIEAIEAGGGGVAADVAAVAPPEQAVD